MAQQHEVHLNQVAAWKRQLPERAAEVFDGGAAGRKEDDPDLEVLPAKIGQQAPELIF